MALGSSLILETCLPRSHEEYLPKDSEANQHSMRITSTSTLQFPWWSSQVLVPLYSWSSFVVADCCCICTACQPDLSRSRTHIAYHIEEHRCMILYAVWTAVLSARWTRREAEPKVQYCRMSSAMDHPGILPCMALRTKTVTFSRPSSISLSSKLSNRGNSEAHAMCYA